MDTADHIAIQNLLHRYCDYLDRGNLHAVAALFAHATVIMPAIEKPFVKDAKGLVEAYRSFVRIYPNGTPLTRHVSTNLILEADGPDRAKAQSYIMVYQAAPELPLQPIVGGRYEDKFERVNGQWRFAERRMDIDLFGNMSAHMKQAFGPPS